MMYEQLLFFGNREQDSVVHFVQCFWQVPQGFLENTTFALQPLKHINLAHRPTEPRPVVSDKNILATDY